MPIRITGLNSGLDTDSIIKSLSSSYQTKIDNVKRKQSDVQYKMDSWSELNKKLYSFYGKTLSNNRYQNNLSTMKAETSSESVSVSASAEAIKGNHKLQVIETAQTGYITSRKLDNINKDSKLNDLGLSSGMYKFNGQEITVDENTTVSSFINALNKNGVNASFDNIQNRFFISAKENGENANFDLSENKTSKELLSIMGLDRSYYLGDDGNYYSDKDKTKKIEDKDLINDIKSGNAAVRIFGRDSEILLDGVSFKNNSNNISVNGLSINIKDKTNENIDINVKKDTSATFDKIKGLIDEYNSLMNEMSKAYNTSRDGYKSLTDEEKDAMSDKEIEKWEEKLKSSALYRDSSLYSVMSRMKEASLGSIIMKDGNKKTLNDFGITSKSYLSASADERYTLDIDENKLKNAIEQNGEETTSFFNELSKKLYSAIDKAMSGPASLSSKYKVYNDKALLSQKNSYDKDISKQEEKMQKEQDKYYKQFAAMESALSKMNSQSNYFSSFFNTKI